MVFAKLFSKLFTFLKTCAILILLNDYFRRNYEEKYNEIVINASVRSIYAFSKCQIHFNTYLLQLQDFINNNPILKNMIRQLFPQNIRLNEISQIKNDEMHIKHYESNNNDAYFTHHENCIYILSDNEKAIDNCVNKVIFHSPPFKLVYELSNIQFMLLEIKLGDTSYKIDLKTDIYNYYVIGNILDKRFFTYYLRNYHIADKSIIEHIAQSDTLFVKLIDHEVNVRELEITDKKYITIQKENYDY
jgi:hypothetical protein